MRLPSARLDEASRLFMAHFKKSLGTATLLSLSASAVLAGPAVSSLNGKLGINYGDYDSGSGQSVTGSVAAPLANNFGAQLDGLYSNIKSDDFYGAGGHFFWRDSARGLVGIAAAGVDAPAFKSYEAGVEAEYYFRYFTPGIYTGYSKLDYNSTAPFIDTDRTAPFGSVYIGFYPLPDLLIRPSYTRKLNNNYYGVELEYTLRSSNLALTAEVIRGQRDYEQTQFGLRYYFGGKKTLKARHREDDPVNIVPGVMTAAQVYEAEYREKQDAYITQLIRSSYVSGGTIIINRSAGLIVGAGGSLQVATYSGGTGGSVGGGSVTVTVPGTIASGGLTLGSIQQSIGNLNLNPTTFTPTSGTLTVDGNTITGGTLTGTLSSGLTLTLNTGALNGASLSGFTLVGDTLTLTSGSINLGGNFGTVTAITGSFISTSNLSYGSFTYANP